MPKTLATATADRLLHHAAGRAFDVRDLGDQLGVAVNRPGVSGDSIF